MSERPPKAAVESATSVTAETSGAATPSSGTSTRTAKPAVLDKRPAPVVPEAFAPAAAVSLPVAAAATSQPITAPIELQQVDDDASGWHELWLQLPGWFASMTVHLGLVLVLALITTIQGIGDGGQEIVVSTAGDSTGPSTEDMQEQMMEASADLERIAATAPPQLSELPPAAPVGETLSPILAQVPGGDAEPKLAGGGTSLENVVGSGTGGGEGNSLELRLNGASRAELLRSGGGTRESERSVMLALKWLAEHQNYDGSWTFQHQKSPKCHGACSHDGFMDGKNAATAMALLPFLGSGQTHQEGTYKRNIDMGLKFLIRSMQVQGDLGSWNELGGTMYGHGMAAIVMCEAYGMTHDPTLQAPAQMAVNYIVEAQDPHGGGWRYEPRWPGDTSVVGWQLMALRSAQMAYLRVPPVTFRKASYFLDYVQSEKGAVYGYKSPEGRRAPTTAIGLLCRMYLGWKHEQLGLQKGVQILSVLGPSIDKTSMKNNMYYNYYATQVMHHYGGYPWQRWNEVMREYLINSQSKHAHETGSWYFDGSDHGSPAGGRLYCTAMAAMTLEVYYRYMPLYRDDSVKGTIGRD